MKRGSYRLLGMHFRLGMDSKLFNLFKFNLFKLFKFIIPLILIFSFVGCSPSCSKKTSSSSQPSLAHEPQTFEAPNYEGLTIMQVIKQDLNSEKKQNDRKKRLTHNQGSKEVQAQDTALVKYKEWIYSPASLANHGPQIFDSKEEGIPIKVGEGQVIRGFEQGLIGMKKGAKRRLIIPASLAYGETGDSRKKIPPKSIILIDAEVVDIQ